MKLLLSVNPYAKNLPAVAGSWVGQRLLRSSNPPMEPSAIWFKDRVSTL